MDIDICYFALAVPLVMGFYIVYETIKMRNEQRR